MFVFVCTFLCYILHKKFDELKYLNYFVLFFFQIKILIVNTFKHTNLIKRWFSVIYNENKNKRKKLKIDKRHQFIYFGYFKNKWEP